MQLARPLFAPDPRVFGKGRIFDRSVASARCFEINADLKLFATTFLAGFVFVTVLIA